MKLLALTHQDDARSGVFAEAAAARGQALTERSFATAGMEPDERPDALIVLGGGVHLDQESLHPWVRAEKGFIREALGAGIPVLGVCLGAQLLAEAAGGRVSRSAVPEIGWRTVELTEAARDDPLLAGLPERFEAFEWHSYDFELPPGGTPLARNPGRLQAYRTGSAWGIQFHAEVTGATVAAWLDRYGEDEDATSARLEPTLVEAETERNIERWNAIGRELSRRFVELAQGRTAALAGAPPVGSGTVGGPTSPH